MWSIVFKIWVALVLHQLGYGAAKDVAGSKSDAATGFQIGYMFCAVTALLLTYILK